MHPNLALAVFNALPGGYRFNGDFGYMGGSADYWCSTVDGEGAYCMVFNYSDVDPTYSSSSLLMGYSVRCVCDEIRYSNEQMNNIIDSLQNAYTELNDSLGNTIDSLNVTNGSLTNTVDSLNVTNSSLTNTVDSLNNVNGTLTNTVDSLNTVNGTLGSTIESLNTENDSLNTALDSLNTAYTELNDSLGNTIDSLNNVNGTLTNTVDSLNNVGGTLTNTIDSLNNVNGTLTNTVDSLNNVNGTLTNTVDSLNNVGGTLTNTIDSLNNVNGSLTNTVDSLNLVNGTLDNTIESLNTENDSLSTALDSLNTAYTELNDSLSTTIDSLNTAYTELNDSLTTAIDSLNTAYTEMTDSLQDALDQQRQAYEDSQIAAGLGFRDERDGNFYRMVTIGQQTWMAENLKYLPSVVGPDTISYSNPYYYVYDYDGTDVNVAKASENYKTYGVLYNWPAAMNGESSSEENPSGVQGVCPTGWHLPSYAEWRQLDVALPGVFNTSSNNGYILAGNASLWQNVDVTQVPEFETTGFYALPGGKFSLNYFNDQGNTANFCSATENSDSLAFYMRISNFGALVNSDKNIGLSVRCVCDEIRYSQTEQAEQMQNAMNEQRRQFEDMLIDAGVGFRDERDDNFYKIVKIGEQTWMAENLRYLNSVVSPENVSYVDPYCYVFGYDGTDVEAAKATNNYKNYGVLYNWLAAMAGESSSEANPSGVQGVCPEGWHLPSNAEWQQLDSALSGSNHGSQLAGNADLWESGSLTSASEFGTSGFNAFPVGMLDEGGYFDNMAMQVSFWSSDETDDDIAGTAYILENVTSLGINFNYKAFGFSVRCVRGGVENGHSYVDLGLPSGTKWAIMNVGANSPEEAGDYFAWGETVPKDDYSWDTYRLGTEDNLTMYNSTDGKTELEATDDAAAQNWGGNWRTPDRMKFYELLNNCTWIWTTQNGVDGYRVVGPNGESIFLPVTGDFGDSGYSNEVAGTYMTSTLYSNKARSYKFLFSSDSNGAMSTSVRSMGNTIRAVLP